MKYNINKIRGHYILFAIVILCLTFQWFSYIPILQHRTIFIAIGAYLVLRYSQHYFVEPAFAYMLLYIFFVIFNFLIGDHYFNSFESILYNEFFPLFFSSALIFYLLKYNKHQLFNIIIVSFGVFLIHSTIISTIANNVMPGLMRYQAFSEAAQSVSYILIPFRRMGLSDYLIPHALCVIIPGFVYLSKQTRGLYRILFIILTGTAWVLSYVSGAFTALLLSSISLVLSLLVNSKKSQKTLYTITLAFILICPIVLNKDLQMSILEGISSILPEESVSNDKITDLQVSLQYGNAEGDVSERSEKLSHSLSVIAENFIWGTDNETIGGHNALLDRFAALGLIGMLPFIMFIYYQFGFIIKYVDGTKRFYFYIGVTCGFLMMLSKNMYTWSMWLFLLVLLPGLLCLGNYSKHEIPAD